MSRTNLNGSKLLEGRDCALVFVFCGVWGGSSVERGDAEWCQEKYSGFA